MGYLKAIDQCHFTLVNSWVWIPNQKIVNDRSFVDFSKSNAQLSIVRILFHHIDHKKHGNQTAIRCGYKMTQDFKLCHLCSRTLYFCDEQQMWQTHIDFWLFFPCCERIFLQKAMFLYHCGQKWQNRIINGKCVSLVKNFIKFSAIFHNITSCWFVYRQQLPFWI